MLTVFRVSAEPKPAPTSPRGASRWATCIAFAIAIWGTNGCSDPFASCEERRTCPLGGAGGAIAGASSRNEGGTSGGIAGAGSPNDSGAGGQVAGATSRGQGGAENAGASSSDDGGAGGEHSEPPNGGSGGNAPLGGSGGSSVSAGGTSPGGTTASSGGTTNSSGGTATGGLSSAGNGGSAAENDCTSSQQSGCVCIVGTTRSCGPCSDGVQACVNGKTGEYTACSGAVLTPSTWYRDADGDGYGSAVTTTVCTGKQPTGYTDKTGDCCDDGGNLTLAAQIHPGQTAWFENAANLCGVTWDYNCSGGHELRTANATAGCASSATPPSCETALKQLTDATCGTSVSQTTCYARGTADDLICTATGNSSIQGCH